MADFFEIDFLDVESPKSGDAITIRYEIDGVTTIHVIDGGYQKTGESLVSHIRKHYGNPTRIDHVVVTHPDADHCGGLRSVLEEFEVGTLWMLRPWIFGKELLPYFDRFSSAENLEKRFREIYDNIKALEDLAYEKGVDIKEPFQGSKIGQFTVLAPTPERWIQCLIDSEKTPESSAAVREVSALDRIVREALAKAATFVKSLWGEEHFPSGGTSAENEMSVVQSAVLCGKKIMLTGDAGRDALGEAADFAPSAGFALPGVDRFQVPHHGGRHNVSTDILDRLLGKRLDQRPAQGTASFTAIVSSAKEDKDHPRKSVVRACIHRGAKVLTTEGKSVRIGLNAPDRDGWVPAQSEPYPEEQEE